jgi:hypothetical protein
MWHFTMCTTQLESRLNKSGYKIVITKHKENKGFGSQLMCSEQDNITMSIKEISCENARA